MRVISIYTWNGCFSTIVFSCPVSLGQEERKLSIIPIAINPIHPLYSTRWPLMTRKGHKECTLETLAEDKWVEMHSELLTNGMKHKYLGFTVKMDDTVKMLPKQECWWQMIRRLCGWTDPLQRLTKGGLFCDLTKVKWLFLHLLSPHDW